MSKPAEPSVEPQQGWHVLHLYYRIRRDRLARLIAEDRQRGARELAAALDPKAAGAPTALQTFLIPGQKAEFGVLLMGPDPLSLAAVQTAVEASALAAALEPAYSFVSLTEVSEYVPTVEQFAQRLRQEGDDPDSPAFQARVRTYEAREQKMRAERLHPTLPDWPVMCFYPMNKKREVGENWFLLDFEERMRLMTEHGRTGQTFAGKVTQLITASAGLDDWEWGVTLWARRPDYLKEIVYTMRFDEASARYAQFGPFFVGYVMPAAELLERLRLA